MQRRMIGALLIALLMVIAAEAKDNKNAKNGTGSVEKKDVGPTVPSAVVEKKVAKLTEQVHWFSSLDEAKTLAQKDNKPIFWLHALGDLDGVC